jgi:hypothetical protein
MEFNGKKIILDREASEIDKFVFDFVTKLKNYTNYVIVSGYVSIVFGRARATEDIDILIPSLDYNLFMNLFNSLEKEGFECINTSNVEEAFDMWQSQAIRFAHIGIPIPNIEFKKAKSDLDAYALNNRIILKIGDEEIFISPLEAQIAFKLYLSSEKGDKDIEDARHLYKLFKENLNKEELIHFVKMLKVEDKLKLLE